MRSWTYTPSFFHRHVCDRFFAYSAIDAFARSVKLQEALVVHKAVDARTVAFSNT